MIAYTDNVEMECPVAKAQGVSGIGEGVVWVSEDAQYKFKVKGEKHSNSKVKVTKTQTPEEIEAIKDAVEFAEYATPVWRLEQMYQETFDTLNGGTGDMTGTGKFLQSVMKDIIKEESDLMVDKNLEPKNIAKFVNQIAKDFLKEAIDREVL